MTHEMAMELQNANSADVYNQIYSTTRM